MKETPIIFSSNMVEALLKGQKTQTRRIIKKQPDKDKHSFISQSTVLDASNRITWTYSDENSINCLEVKFPYGKIGDFLWVKETFLNLNKIDESPNYIYKAGNITLDMFGGKKWKSALFMPKSAARIWLRITNVQVKRLIDISKDDAIAEGIERDHILHWWKNYLDKPLPGTSDPIESFKTLWQSIYSEESWNDNPLVWVIEFERI